MFDPTKADVADLLSHMGDTIPDAGEWPKRLHDLFEVVEAALKRREKADEHRRLLARDVAMAIGEYLGGRQFYIPSGDSLRLAIRDREIYHAAKRGNVEQLAQAHDLHVVHVYRILREQHALHLRKIQGRLFEEG